MIFHTTRVAYSLIYDANRTPVFPGWGNFVAREMKSTGAQKCATGANISFIRFGNQGKGLFLPAAQNPRVSKWQEPEGVWRTDGLDMLQKVAFVC